MRLPDEDLQRALVGVLGIGLIRRMPPRDTQQRLGVLGDGLHDELLRIEGATTAEPAAHDDVFHDERGPPNGD